MTAAVDAASGARRFMFTNAAGHPDERLEQRLLAACLGLFMALQALFVFRFNINWDEYFFLSHIHAFREGRLAVPMQTFHVQLLGWVARLPLAEADQVVAGRLVMLACEAGMLACLYAIGRAFFTMRETVFALVVYVTSGWVLGHGVSFRADPLAAFLMVASLALLFRAPCRWPAAMGAGVLAAIGLLVTIKAVLYLPAFLAAFLWRSSRSGWPVAVRFFALAGITLLAVGLAGWLFHGASIAADNGLAATSGSAASAYDKTIGSQGWFPRRDYIARWALLSSAGLIAVAVGLAGAIRASGGDRTRAAVLLLLVAPILSLVFYRNAFPYFFPYIFATVAIIAAFAARELKGRPLFVALMAAMMISLAAQAAMLWQRDQSAQRQVAAVAHGLFPQPVPYIDRNGMLPSFEKVGFFMSSWGVEGIRARGVPALKPVIEQRQPPLVVANSPQLAAAFGLPADTGGLDLLPGDVAALRDNYIHHWGALWVAGKQLRAQTGEAHFDLAIAGVYTVECVDGHVRVDGQPVRCGSAVALRPGRHGLAADRMMAVTLRWGDRLLRPTVPEPEKPVFYGF